MKHISKLSQPSLNKAGEWEDFICVVVQTANTILGFFGGSSPFLLFIDSKCAIPTPNDSTTPR